MGFVLAVLVLALAVSCEGVGAVTDEFFPSTPEDVEAKALAAVADRIDAPPAAVRVAVAVAPAPASNAGSVTPAASASVSSSSLQAWGVAVLTIGAVAMALGVSLGLLGTVRMAEKPKGSLGFVESRHVVVDAKETNVGAVLAVCGAISFCVGVIFVGVAIGVAPVRPLTA